MCQRGEMKTIKEKFVIDSTKITGAVNGTATLGNALLWPH